MKRAERRADERVKQKKRLRDLRDTNPSYKPDLRAAGRLRHSHNWCSCAWCKPHKFGIEPQYRVSERRRLDETDT